ncbi:MAG TPA: dihydropyrimidinase [Candidatus Dormibacteraeota bacterium]|jgi:dihydropyrimidinase|nr:dihydropyrimidinase [Candidatus Dormibacteraeota bacterium]
MTTTLLTGGTVASAMGSYPADVLIDSGRIAAVGAGAGFVADRVVDVSGKILLPGGVDVHTHLDAPFMGTITADDFNTGTIAAACGGTTTIVDFAMQSRGQKLGAVLEQWHAKAAGRAAVDYGFHMAVTDLYDGAVADMDGVIRDGVTSFKLFMAYKGQIMLDDGEIFRILRTAGRSGATVCLHAENGYIIDVLAEELVHSGKRDPTFHAVSRPPATEIEAVRRAIAIARMADAPVYFVHLSTAGAVDAVGESRMSGWPVAGETCTHYLLLGPELYDAPDFEGAKVVLTPPLREAPDREALWASLRTGVLSVVSSDHCPFCFVGQKEMGRDDFRKIPNGGPGIEHRLLLLYGQGVRQGRLTLEQFVDVVATSPAKQFGLFPRKGAILPGADADVVVLDPAGTTTIAAATQHQNLDYTPYEGWTVPGRIDAVYLRGELVVRDGDYVAAAPGGAFLARRTL